MAAISPFETIRIMLGDTATTIFKNTTGNTVQCNNIIFCNTHSTSVKVSFLIRNPYDPSSLPNLGAILFNLDLDPNETLSVPDRRLNKNDYLVAFSNLPNKVSFYADLQKFSI